MGNNNTENHIRGIVSSSRRIGGKNPVQILAAKTGKDQATVRRMIEELAERGEIRVERTDGRITSVRAVARPFVDPTERSAESKRQRRFAKGVPATLPDSLCGPVIVSHRDSKPKPKVYNRTDPLHVRLTLCLAALREAADGGGYGKDISMQDVLMGRFSVSKDEAKSLLKYLRVTGCYATQKTSKLWSYQLDLEITEVTKEMLSDFRRQSRAAQTKLNEVALQDAPVVEADESETDDSSVVQRLTEIIKRLEARIEELQDQNAQLANLQAAIKQFDEAIFGLQGENDTLSRQNKGLGTENAALRTQVDELQARLNRSMVVDPEVDEILKRHGMSS